MVKFMYHPKIVAAIKQLPPNQRSFDPLTKQWPIDLLALPAMLEHLRPMGYVPCDTENNLGSTHDSVEANTLICTEAASSSITTSNLVNKDSARRVANSTPAGTAFSKPVEENIKAALLQAELKTVCTLLTSQSNEQKGNVIDRSDCGQVKRRRLTDAQETWGMRKSLGFYDNDDFDYMGYSDCSLFSNLLTRLSSRTTHRFPVDCDCGKPHVLSGGRHVCRYFGTFQCSCGNPWTSGYTWKGEMQACKRCNVESLPLKKEKLMSGDARGIGGEPLDAARCSRCRKLGYDCSGYYNLIGLDII